ncbi:dTDP-4-dehydrorhamnose reductase [Rhodococcus sp. 05-339-2]|uniref:dTDP-4-dehydrorhamnose reductase n=1 Tax=Rhodococcoides fascians TaxID=1828 RepID=UPI00050CDB11|nr:MULTISPECIES: dTDP-4-dehydrorhamnose reductase [Rhodococcus]OZD77979.1 dTDP-4-dehydrorhamnose reductase [Rhodococcus sp. 05-339-2]
MNAIVVTGAHGQLGRRVMSLAAERGDGVEVFGYSSADLDITDPDAVAAAVTAGATVINCAAYTAVDAAETDEARASAVNADGPRNLARACGRVGARLIHVSTDYVFDGTATEPYEVDAKTAPQSAYGRTKLAGELAVHEELPEAVIVRTAWVYDNTGKNFVTTMRRLEGERETISVVDDQIGSPTFAHDLASGLLELEADPAVRGRTLHYTNAGQASWFDLARAVFAGIGADPERVQPCSSAEYVVPAPRPAYSVLSPTAWVDAGLTPARPWSDALTAALTQST